MMKKKPAKHDEPIEPEEDPEQVENLPQPKPTRAELIAQLRNQCPTAGRFNESEMGEILDWLFHNDHLKGWA